MKYLLCLPFIFSLQSLAQTASDDILKALVRNEQELVDAIAVGDRAVWMKHLHDQCLIAIEDGSTMTKQQFIEELNTLPAGYVGRIQIIQPTVRAHGQTAVLSFVDDEYLELYHQKIHTQYRQTDTWMNIDGEWRIIAMQLFEIPKNPPPITVDSTVLKRYAGTYVLSAEKKCVVSVENGKLYVQKGKNQPQELLGETENVFFRSGDGRVNVIFRKQSDGAFLMIERREGEDLVWRMQSAQ